VKGPPTERSSDPALLLLVSLASGAKHGYAMIEDIEGFAGVRLGPGTLYGALERLETAGLIEPVATEDRRRPYRLTSHGAAALRAQVAGLRRVTRAARQRLAS
jgi:DNA-binding PadR family transcriptional regulator